MRVQQIQNQPIFGISGTYSLPGAKKPMKFSEKDIDSVLDGITYSIKKCYDEKNYYKNVKITEADSIPGYKIIKKLAKGAKSLLYVESENGQKTAIISKFEGKPFSLLRTEPENIEPLKDDQFIIKSNLEGNLKYNNAVKAMMDEWVSELN